MVGKQETERKKYKPYFYVTTSILLVEHCCSCVIFDFEVRFVLKRLSVSRGPKNYSETSNKVGTGGWRSEEFFVLI